MLHTGSCAAHRVSSRQLSVAHVKEVGSFATLRPRFQQRQTPVPKIQNVWYRRSSFSSVCSASTDTPVTTSAPSSMSTRTGPLVMTFDNTQNAQDALSWSLNALHYSGDEVVLVHVVCDPRSLQSPTSVGTTASGRPMAFDPVDRTPYVRDYTDRLTISAEEAVKRRCAVLQEQSVAHKVRLPRLPVPRSAAIIGETVLREAEAEGGRLLVVASHGPGALAEFGSVARYCFQHSKQPLVLVPPGVSVQPASGGQDVVVLVNQLQELSGIWTWVTDNLCKKGDTLHVWHVRQGGAGGDAAAALPPNMAEAAQQRAGIKEMKLHVLDAAGMDANDLGNKVCDLVDGPATKAVVTLNYSSRGLVMEAMHGSLASHLSRFCRKPLVLLPPSA